MRAILILALAGQCSAEGRRAGPPAAITGIHVETVEGESSGDPDQPRLDLGSWEPWTTGESTGGSSGGEDSTAPTTSDSTGAGKAGTSTGGSTSTGEDASTGAASTSGASTSGASTGEDSTGGESSTGGPLTDCPCVDGADNVCDLDPGVCSATLPGGLCDPDGNGDYLDGDWTLGWQEYHAKCA
jgi:hypothetical protein